MKITLHTYTTSKNTKKMIYNLFLIEIRRILGTRSSTRTGATLVSKFIEFMERKFSGRKDSRRETHTFIDVKRWICCPKLSPRSFQVTSTSTPLNEQILFALAFLVALLFLKFHVSPSSVKNSWYYYSLLFFGRTNAREKMMNVRERPWERVERE